MSDQNHDTKEAAEGGYRIMALFLDFFLFFTAIALILAPIFKKGSIGDFALITLGALLLWEILFREMPGKWLLKLKIHYEKEEKKKFHFYMLRPLLKYLLSILAVLYSLLNSRHRWFHDYVCGTVVVNKPFRLRPAAAIVYFMVGLNLYLTVGCGTVFWQERKKAIPLGRVNMLPQPVTITGPGFSEPTAGIWLSELRCRFPQYYKGLSLESCYGYNGYGLTTWEGKKESGCIRILQMKSLHPYWPCLCGIGILYKNCSGTPRDVQEKVFHSTTHHFYTAWNFFLMMRLQNRLHFKGIHLKGKGDAFSFRKLSLNGISMIWIFKDNDTRASEIEASDELYDYIYMATPRT